MEAIILKKGYLELIKAKMVYDKLLETDIIENTEDIDMLERCLNDVKDFRNRVYDFEKVYYDTNLTFSRVNKDYENYLTLLEEEKYEELVGYKIVD